MTDETSWLAWARRIQAIAQSGLAFTKDPFDRERYEQLTELAAEIVDEHTGSEVDQASLRQGFLAQVGYGTPKVGVRAAIVEEGKILLVRERLDGLWAMPGGWADVGESGAAMAVRETWEEASVVVRVRRLVGVWSTHQHRDNAEFWHHYKMIYLCERVGGEPAPGPETTEVAFFDLDDLPELSTGRNSYAHLEYVRRVALDPTLPTHFD